MCINREEFNFVMFKKVKLYFVKQYKLNIYNDLINNCDDIF